MVPRVIRPRRPTHRTPHRRRIRREKTTSNPATLQYSLLCRRAAFRRRLARCARRPSTPPGPSTSPRLNPTLGRLAAERAYQSFSWYVSENNSDIVAFPSTGPARRVGHKEQPAGQSKENRFVLPRHPRVPLRCEKVEPSAVHGEVVDLSRREHQVRVGVGRRVEPRIPVCRTLSRDRWTDRIHRHTIGDAAAPRAYVGNEADPSDSAIESPISSIRSGGGTGTVVVAGAGATVAGAASGFERPAPLSSGRGARGASGQDDQPERQHEPAASATTRCSSTRAGHKRRDVNEPPGQAGGSRESSFERTPLGTFPRENLPSFFIPLVEVLSASATPPPRVPARAR